MALKSLISQDLPKKFFEIIVVDNNSIDRTREIIKKFPVRYAFERKRGTIAARQKGVDIAKGKIIASADADTFYPKNWLSEIKKAFEDNPDAIAVCGWIYFKNTSTFFSHSVALAQEANAALKRLIGKFPLVYAANFAFKKNALDKIGNYPKHIPELGDQQYILYNFFKIGKVLISRKIYCITSARRHKQGALKDIFLYNGWYRIAGFIINSIFKKEIIPPAPAIRER
ncbi:MAG: glycosyltransferase [Candidatus Jordarchaeaceae archaeon]